jgi:uncharacterized protein (TIGR03067 family)
MRTLTLALALFLPALLVAAPVPKDKEKPKDEDAIVGTWKIDQFDADGGNAPSQPTEIKFVFAEKGQFSMIRPGPDRGDRGGTFKIDPTAKVKTMDISLDGQDMKAIYELDGDTLKMCIPDKPNSPRPEAFVANAKERVAVVTFKREKAEKKDK